ncbi:MAG: PAS domain S-box protein [Desulfovibrio sp.]|nr:MAG: PAS domain S-box protein [Desulfovibrio sp.]
MCRDGSVIDVHIDWNYLRNEEGALTGFTSIVTDITERKQAEDTLRENKAILDRAQKIGRMGSYVWDIPNNEVTWSEQLHRNLGLEGEAPSTERFFSMIHPEDAERVHAQGDRARALAEPVALEFRVVLPDGSVVHVLDQAEYETDAQGNTIRMFGISQDITERKQAAMALKESETQFRALFEQAGWAVIVHDLNGRFLDVNRRSCEQLGYSKEELLSMSVVDVDPEARARGDKENFWLGDLPDEFTFEGRHKRKDGSIYPALITVTRIELAGKPAIIALVLDISEQKEAEQEISDINETLLNILDSIPADIYLADLDTYEVLFMNRQMKESFGRDLTGELCHLAFRHSETPCAHCTNKYLVDESGRPKDIMTWEDFNPITGKWYLNCDRAITWLKGRKARIQIATDITERKLGEQALMESEERFRMLSEVLLSGVVIHDHGVLLEANDQYYNMFGYTPEELLGKDAATLTVHPEALDELRANIRSGVTDAYESVGLHKDGTTFPIEIEARNIHYKGRQVRAGVIKDITRGKQMQAERDSYLNLLQSTLNSLDSLIMVIDKEHRVILSNWHGHASVLEELRNAHPHCHEILKNLEQRCEVCHPGDTFRDGKVRQYEDHDPLDGSYKDISVIPIFNSRGEVDYVLKNIRDVTQHKRVQAELLAAKQTAELANKVKSEFLANMSHEIRTPLNGVLGMLQLLQMTNLNGEQEDFVNTAMRSSRRLTRLLADILDLSMVEQEKLQLRMGPFDLAKTVSELADLFTPSAKKTGIELRIHIDPTLPAEVLGDSSRLLQVFTNMVGNAFKYTHTGNITVGAHRLSSLRQGQCRVLFTVADTGIGIPDDKLEALFQPFSQISQGFSREFQGAGLGLSICKRLITLMEGSICIESKEGAGITVYFSIPFQLPQAREQGALDQDQAGVENPSSLRVLVAEDDATSRFAVVQQLKKSGHEAVAAEDGQQALDILSDQAFDVILMDVQMPVLDGVGATKAIRDGKAGQDNASIPIIAMTAYAMVGDKEIFLEAGMDGYLAKPVEMDVLKAVLGKVAAKSS